MLTDAHKPWEFRGIMMMMMMIARVAAARTIDDEWKLIYNRFCDFNIFFDDRRNEFECGDGDCVTEDMAVEWQQEAKACPYRIR